MPYEEKIKPINEMHSLPLVSIITPTFNSAKYIRETIASVQAQTYNNWQHILIDDGSTDTTVSIVTEIAQKDERISIIQLKNNSGSAVARNKGINLAKGKYLTFIDSDDVWFPNFIETSINTIQKYAIPFVYASYRRANEHLEFVYSDFIVPEKVTYTDILKTNSISCLTAFIDVDVLGKKEMPLVRKRQDMGLWLQYLKIIPYAKGISTPLAIYRIRKDSLSRKKKDLLASQWEFYRRVENLSFFTSFYYMICWMYYGYKKYRT